MIALFRLAKQRPTTAGADVVAGILLAITMLVMLAPGGLFLFPPPWNMRYVAGQVHRLDHWLDFPPCAGMAQEEPNGCLMDLKALYSMKRLIIIPSTNVCCDID